MGSSLRAIIIPEEDAEVDDGLMDGRCEGGRACLGLWHISARRRSDTKHSKDKH